MSPRKPRTAAKTKKLCVELAKKIVRSAARCEKCNKTNRQFHGAHILSTGAYPAMSAELDNILCLCASCHTMAPDSWHKEIIKNCEWLESKYPGRIAALKVKAQTKIKVDWELKLEELKQWKM